MIGSSVRSLYQKGKGFPCFVSVEQDGTGTALQLCLALARAIGATKVGAIASSVREETAMDLFAEQALWPNIIMLFRYYLYHFRETYAKGIFFQGNRSKSYKKQDVPTKLCVMKCSGSDSDLVIV